LMGAYEEGTALNDFLLCELATFTGDDWQQEDDVTLMSVHRASCNPGRAP